MGSKQPIDLLLDKLEWEELPKRDVGEIPHATHRGILRIAGAELECFVLSNGQRVFSEESVVKFFEALES